MIYEITTSKDTALSTDYITVYTVTIKIYSGDDSTSALVLTGVSSVVGDEDTVTDYAKYVMLADLKTNFSAELADLELPTEDDTTTTDDSTTTTS